MITMNAKNLNIALLAANEARQAAVKSHQQLARCCQTAQEGVDACLRRHLMHGRRWHVNSRWWHMERIDTWLTANIEFSEPTLCVRLTLRPEDDEPLVALLLELHLRLMDMDLSRPFPSDVSLPCTLPMNSTVELCLHRRANVWRTYPEVNAEDLTPRHKLQQPL